MREFKGRVAVVTGAASGIGRALAERCAAEGLRVVLADVESEPLEAVAEALRQSGAEVLAVRTDVADASAVDALADASFAHFGSVHLLFNNAGVATSGPILRSTLADWEWVLGVNLWGVIHGVRAFVPRMCTSGDEGHVVNTASIMGLLTMPGAAAYTVSKHGVVVLSETLAHELKEDGAPIGVSVLCPAAVDTAIPDSGRNRPGRLQNPPGASSPEEDATKEEIRAALKTGLAPQAVADLVFAAIAEGVFYIHTHEESKSLMEKRFRGVLEGTEPFLPDWGEPER